MGAALLGALLLLRVSLGWVLPCLRCCRCVLLLGWGRCAEKQRTDIRWCCAAASLQQAPGSVSGQQAPAAARKFCCPQVAAIPLGPMHCCLAALPPPPADPQAPHLEMVQNRRYSALMPIHRCLAVLPFPPCLEIPGRLALKLVHTCCAIVMGLTLSQLPFLPPARRSPGAASLSCASQRRRSATCSSGELAVPPVVNFCFVLPGGAGTHVILVGFALGFQSSLPQVGAAVGWALACAARFTQPPMRQERGMLRFCGTPHGETGTAAPFWRAQDCRIHDRLCAAARLVVQGAGAICG